MKYNQRGSIKWDTIDYGLLEDFERKYSNPRKIDRFLYSWIILNHYYSAWAQISPPAIQKGSTRPGEKSEIINFSQSTSAIAAWERMKLGSHVRSLNINLPIFDGNGNPYPTEQNQEAGIMQLSLEQFLLTLYYIRCDFFHGDRRLRGYSNEKIIMFSSECCYQYVKCLIDDTGKLI